MIDIERKLKESAQQKKLNELQRLKKQMEDDFEVFDLYKTYLVSSRIICSYIVPLLKVSIFLTD